jgi:8-amino-7-oxononanoate synthase
LYALTSRLLDGIDRLGIETPNRSGLPIVEVPLRDHRRIAEVGQYLFDQGIYVTLAAYPLVPKAEVGFRMQLTAANTDSEVDAALDALEELAARGLLRAAGASIGTLAPGV